MAIRLIDRYPNRANPANADYPHGSGRNKSSPTAIDGTPFDENRYNDHEGFFQSLLEAAEITPNNTPDTVPESQYADALSVVANGLIEIDVGGSTDAVLDYNQSRVHGFLLTGALAGDIDMVVPDTERMYTVVNDTTGDFTVTVKTALGAGVIVSQGQTFIVRCDGVDVVRGVDSQSVFFGRSLLNGLKPGKNIHIYEWGSPFGGNDWCFVRTPDNYDPRGASHPVLILNHGNGWVMDGTESKANFSEKTQFGVDSQNGGTYLDTGRSDYVEFSSPMIEAFLAEGYVVCGAQNDGQNYGAGSAGYGNREVRQNIKLFFDHMKANYNVEKWCHMIGASNGCLATLNACTIMGRDLVRSVTLLYPLINLHAAWRAQYETDVATAYEGFSPSGDFVQFRGSTETHDPMVAYTDFSMRADDENEAIYANANFYRITQDGTSGDVTWVRENRLVDSSEISETDIALADVTIYRRSIFPWPRIRCHWSPEDTVVPQEYHWQAFERLLDRGGHVRRGLQVLGEHGDYRHFELLDGTGVAGMIAWTRL